MILFYYFIIQLKQNISQQKQSIDTTLKRGKNYDKQIILNDENYQQKIIKLQLKLENELKELKDDINSDQTLSNNQFKLKLNSQQHLINSKKEEKQQNYLLKSIDEDQNIQRYLSLFTFGKGSFGCVKQVYDTIEKKYFAEKEFNNTRKGQQEYLYEKSIMKQLQSVLSDSDMFAHLIDYNDDNRRLIYECGYCSLKELIDYKINNNLLWHEDDIIYISWKLIEMLLQLNEVSFYHSDWKPANITIFSNEQTVMTWISIIKLIDFGSASRQFNLIQGYTPFFAPADINSLKFENQSQRIAFEAFQIGRIIQQLILHSEFFNYVDQSDQNIFNQHNQIECFKIKVSEQISNNLILRLINMCLQDNQEINTTSQQYIENMNLLMIDLKNETIQKKIQGLNRIDNWDCLQQIKKIKNEEFLKNINEEQDLVRNINKFKNYLMFESALKLSYKLALKYEQQFTQLINNKQQNVLQFENIIQILYNLIEQIDIYMQNLNHPKTYVNWYVELIRNILKHGVKFQQVCKLHNFLGQAYCNTGQLSQAEEQFNIAIELLKNNYEEEKPTFATLFSNLGGVYRDQGKLIQAENQFLKAIELQKKIYGEEHSTLATSFSNLGNVYYSQGKLKEAESQYLQALELEKKNYDQEHPIFATSFSNLGNVYSDLGKLTEAEIQFRKAIEIDKKCYGDEHPNLAIRFSNLGNVYYNQGKLIEAETQFLKAIELEKKSYGEEHPNLAIRFNNLGNVFYKNQGKLQEAETQFLKAIEIEKKSYGEEHPNLAIRFNNLGNVYSDQGKLQEAETQFLKSIEIEKKSYGEDHPNLAIRQSNLGNVYYKQGKLQQAEVQFLKTIELLKKNQREEHTTLATQFSYLGMVYSDQGKLKEAETQFRKAIEIDKKRNGQEHSNLAIWLSNLGNIYRNQGKLKKAKTLIRKAIKLEKKSYGEDHPTLAILFNNLGLIYKNQGKFKKVVVYKNQDKFKKAETQFLKAIELEKKSYGEKHPALANLFNNLGNVYRLQGKLKKAETQFLNIIELQKNSYGEDHPNLATSFNNLGLVYKNQGKLKEAETQFLNAIELTKKSQGEQHTALATLFRNLGNVYLYQRMIKEAESQYLKAIELEKKKSD